jgi:GNAT superfamily N-acetyltransferase
MSRWSIRDATVDDIPAMHVVRMSVRENVLSPRLASVITAASYRAMLEHRGCGWVCESADAIVGFSVADLEAQNIWALFVDPEHERRGIGRELLERAVVWLFDRGVEKIWLSTESGSRAEAFYRAAGWHAAEARAPAADGEVRFELHADMQCRR